MIIPLWGPITCSFATDAEFMMNMSRVLLEHEGVYSTKQLDLKTFPYLWNVIGQTHEHHI